MNFIYLGSSLYGLYFSSIWKLHWKEEIVQIKLYYGAHDAEVVNDFIELFSNFLNFFLGKFRAHL